jgi:hypothetical protein
MNLDEKHKNILKIEKSCHTSMLGLRRMINVLRSTLRCHLKRGNLRKCRSVIKPYLTKANKQKCIAYCLYNQGKVDPYKGKRPYNDYPLFHIISTTITNHFMHVYCRKSSGVLAIISI